MSAARAVGVLTTDREFSIRTWDAWLEQATNISAAAARGKVLHRLFPEIVSRGLSQSLERVLQSGVVEVLAPAFHHYLIACKPEHPSKRFDKMQQRVTIAPLREENRIVGLMITIEDVTARVEEERGAPNDLSDEDWRNRKRAVEQLAQQRTDDVVKTLLASLRDEHHNPAVLNSALQVLSMSGWDVVAPLTEFLRGPDADLRIYAALALGEQKNPGTVSALIDALNDPEPNVRYHAIEALGKLRASEATQPLIDIVHLRDFFLSYAAIDALAAIGDPRCVPFLVELLGDEYLGSPAAETLGKLGEVESVEPLIKLLNRGKLAAPVVAGALAAIYDRYEVQYGEGAVVSDLAGKQIDSAGAAALLAALKAAQPESLRSLALVIGWLEGEEIHRALVDLLSDRSVRKELFEALVRHGRKVSNLVIEQLHSDDLETRRAAVTVLGQLGETRAVPHLVETLSADSELTVAAADALARIGDRGAFESLLNLLGHEKAAVRQAAVAAINSLGHPEMAPRAKILLQNPNNRIRESAVRIAGYFAFPECVDLLIQLCNDPDEGVRRAAVEHLPYLEDSRVVDILLHQLEHGSPKIRAAAAQAAGEMKDEHVPDALKRALKDDDPWVRYYSARSTAKLGASNAITVLGELAQGDASPFVRIAAIEALGLVGAEAVKRLQPLAASEDRDIASAALLALGRTGASDAMPSLLEAAHHTDSDRRIDAATAFSRFGGTESVKILQWLGADNDKRVADIAVTRLAAMSSAEAITALIGLTAEKHRREPAIAALVGLGEKHNAFIASGLGHPQAEVRASVVEAFGRMKHPRASDWIAHALDDMAASVRLAAVNCLARSGNTGHTQKLIRVAKADPDIKVRQAARRVVEPPDES